MGNICSLYGGLVKSSFSSLCFAIIVGKICFVNRNPRDIEVRCMEVPLVP